MEATAGFHAKLRAGNADANLVPLEGIEFEDGKRVEESYRQVHSERVRVL